MATQKRGNVSLEEVRLALDRSLSGTDAMRGSALAGLGRLRAVKSVSLEREQARLKDKYGARDERTIAVAERAGVNKILVQQVTAEAARAVIDTPAVDPEAWILHGRVLDAQLQGVPSLTIALHDANGTWLRKTGHACTDEAGHFLLSVKVGRVPAVPGNEKADAKQAPVFLRVLDAKGGTLHADAEPLVPTPGRVDYRQIVLGEPPAQCTPPDGDKTPGPKRDEPRGSRFADARQARDGER